MPNLPSGTVTFFMSDIEGSTRLVGQLGGDFPRLLDDHFAVMGEVIERHGGTIVSSEGDSIFAVFPAARGAVAAAVEGQRALAAHEWPAKASVKVRMGLHAGEAMFGGRDYTGIDVHRTARIMGAGHGGQIVVSDAARALAGEDPAAAITFRDLGTHALRDLPAPERLFGVQAPGLERDFPALRTAAPDTPTNLPTPLTRFVGRARELEQVRALVDAGRLVTLTGPGGTGKTRLTIETARSLLAEFPDGVWFVALDVVRDPALVVPTIATTLRVPEQPGRTVAAVLTEHLASRRVLLVLDNFEQVSGAAPDVAALLGATTNLRVLVSSREPLAVAGEHLYPVPPLSLPGEPGRPTAAQLADQEAVILFVERARAVRPTFELTDANAPAVAAICRRLDGLPLALELAAARCNLLSPEQILARLDNRLTLLASSRRDLPDRQRTLRGAIDWSHDLLEPPERRFFRAFSVFTGGADLDAVPPVVDPDEALGVDVLDLSGSLVDRSLIRLREVGLENRLEMLETIREYAAEQLVAAGEEAITRRCHAQVYLALAESAADVLSDPRRDQLLDRLDLELPNFRSAIAWSLEAGEPDIGLGIAAALREFWHTRNHIPEGRRLTEQLLEASADAGSTLLRVRGLATASELASWHGDHAMAFSFAQRADDMAREVGDPLEIANTSQGLGWATFFSRPDFALEKFDDAIAFARHGKSTSVLLGALQGSAMALLALRRMDDSRARIGEALALAESIGDRYTQAFHRSTAGFIEIRAGELRRALENFGESVRLASATGSQNAFALALSAIAHVALEQGDAETAAQLAAAAQRVRADLGGGLEITMVGFPEPLDRAREALPGAAFEAATSAGAALSSDEAAALALDYTRGVRTPSA